jgi:hypothetical protein
MRPGPATQAASLRGFLLPWSPLRGGRPLRPDSAPRNAAFAKASCDARPYDREPQLLRRASKPSPDQGSGEEAATPGATSRVSAFLEIPAGSAAIIRHSGLSRFRCTHSQAQHCAPQYKRNRPLCRTCGRPAFLVEERGKLRKIYEAQPPRHPRCACAAGRYPERLRCPHRRSATESAFYRAVRICSRPEESPWF